MKVGMQKVNDNEWLIQMGNAVLRLDRFTTHLLRISLKNALAASHNESFSLTESYMCMTLKLKYLAPNDWPILIQHVGMDAMRIWLTLLKDEDLKRNALRLMGTVAEKQMREDIATMKLPEKTVQKTTLRAFVEKIYELEDMGCIEFYYEASAYI